MPFETKFKSKIPAHLAYPVSASELVAKLGGVPQSAQVKVMYSSYRTGTGVNSKHRDNSNDILTISYRSYPIGLSTPNKWLKRDATPWEMTVYAISKSSLTAIKNLLQAEGFEHLLQWLVRKNSLDGTIGHHELRILFDGQGLKYEESVKL
jgi:hypothetical protein